MTSDPTSVVSPSSSMRTTGIPEHLFKATPLNFQRFVDSSLDPPPYQLLNVAVIDRGHRLRFRRCCRTRGCDSGEGCLDRCLADCHAFTCDSTGAGLPVSHEESCLVRK